MFLKNSLKRMGGRILPMGLSLLLFGLFFFFLSKAAFNFLADSSFSIETVEASSSSPDFSFKDPSLIGSLLGRNIFKVNLPDLQAELSQKHPELLASSVSREFPNRIRIHVTPRLPVARVQSGEVFWVDQEGVILPSSYTLSQKELPLIIGVQKKRVPVHVGHRLHSMGLTEALLFIASLQQLPELTRFVHTIDVRDDENLSFRTPEDLEVRVGKGDYQEKMKRFDRTRVTLGDRIDEIKYIDLRFDDVVIGSR